MEGIRRAGGAAHGQDCVDQPRYRERFGRETFSVGGPDDVSRLRELRSRSKAFVGSLCQVVSDDGDELVVEYWRLDLTKAARKAP